MKYENPNMELMVLQTLDVIRTSSGLDDGNGQDYHETGQGNSTSTGGEAPW